MAKQDRVVELNSTLFFSKEQADRFAGLLEKSDGNIADEPVELTQMSNGRFLVQYSRLVVLPAKEVKEVIGDVLNEA